MANPHMSEKLSDLWDTLSAARQALAAGDLEDRERLHYKGSNRGYTSDAYLREVRPGLVRAVEEAEEPYIAQRAIELPKNNVFLPL